VKWFLFGVWFTVMLIAGISNGWKSAAGIFLLVCFVAGVWTVISAGVDALLRPQEPRTGPSQEIPVWYPDPRDGDPTRPQDEHPVIVLKDYQWRRVK
jgi:hypothetical protein